MYLYSVATGRFNLGSKKFKKTAKFMKDLEGFVAVHPDRLGTLWMFDSLNNAKGARNLAKLAGIRTGRNICEFEWDGDSTITFIKGQEE